jgi:predicted MFS family arabinose efflux permease
MLYSHTTALNQEEDIFMRERKISPNAITAFLMLGYTIIYMDKSVIGTALIPMASQFSLTKTESGLIVSLFFLGYSIMQIPLGYLADHIGYKPVLIFSLSSCILFTLLFGFAGIFPLFLAIRFMMGIGDAGYPSSSAKSVALNYPLEKRPFAQSLLLSTAGIGGILAAVIGVNMISAYGWRSIYYMMSGFFALALLGIIIFLPNKKIKSPDEVPKEKVKLSQVISNTNVWIIFFAMMSYNIVIYSLTTWMPTFVMTTFRLKKVSQVSPLIAAAALLGICGSLLAGRLYGKLIGKEKPMLLITAASLAVILTVASVTRQFAAVCILLSVAVFICEFLFVGLFTWPHKILKKDMIGSSIGVINTGGTLGGFIGPALFGVVIDNFKGSFVPAFIGMGIFALLSGLLSLTVSNKRVTE